MRLLKTIRRWLVVARDGIDGWLHPWRSRSAAARIQELDPRSILVVCLGNVCRSPYAEWVIRARGDGSRSVHSAGFIGPGRQPPDDALAAALARGVDHSSHRSKLLSTDMVNSGDAVLVFDIGNVRRLRQMTGARVDHVFRLGDFDPIWTGKRAIADPWGKSRGQFEVAFSRIERCVDKLLGALDAGHPP